jgi:hypothetical protein
MYLILSYSIMKQIFFLLLIYSNLFGQASQKQNIETNIQYIEIQNNSLKKYIEQYIDKNKMQNKLFKEGLGFVVINNIHFSLNSGRPMNTNTSDSLDNDISSYLSLNIEAYPLYLKDRADCINCNFFPPYYTIINNKIILIYEDNLFGLYGRKYLNDTHNSHLFTRKSKKKLSNLIFKKALIKLPDDYMFEDFLDKNIKLSTLKNKLINKKDIFIYYEFIDFKVYEVIFFDTFEMSWKKKM